MSYLFRWVRQQQSLASRTTAMISGKTAALSKTATTVKPLYQVAQVRNLSTSQAFNKKTLANDDNSTANKEKHNKPDDGIEYEISFKRGLKVKDVIKQFYSLYGPVFVACHILVSLTSLGFFCSLVLLSVNLTDIMTPYMLEWTDEKVLKMTENGGKFVMAYTLHKCILPIRLGLSIFLTRFVSRMIKARRQ